MFYNFANIVDEQEKTNKKLDNILEKIPKKNNYELKIDELYNENLELKKQNEELRMNAISSRKLNNKLIDYIKDIEGIKEKGGIKAEIKTIYNPDECKDVSYDVTIIPEFRIYTRRG